MKQLDQLRILQKTKQYTYFDTKIEGICHSIYWISNWDQCVTITYMDLHEVVMRFTKILNKWDKISYEHNRHKYAYIALRILHSIKTATHNKNNSHTIALKTTDELYSAIHNSGTNRIPKIYQLINSYFHVLYQNEINIYSNIAYEYARCLLSMMYLWGICNKSPKRMDKVVVPWEEPTYLSYPQTKSNTNSNSTSISQTVSITPHKKSITKYRRYDPSMAAKGQQMLSDMENGRIPFDEYPPGILQRCGIYELVAELKDKHFSERNHDLQPKRSPKHPTPVTKLLPCQQEMHQNDNKDNAIVAEQGTNTTADPFTFLLDVYMSETNQSVINDSELNVLMLFYDECHGNIAEIMKKMCQQLPGKFHTFG